MFISAALTAVNSLSKPAKTMRPAGLSEPLLIRMSVESWVSVFDWLRDVRLTMFRSWRVLMLVTVSAMVPFPIYGDTSGPRANAGNLKYVKDRSK